MNGQLINSSFTILVENVSVHYKRSKNQAASLKELAIQFARRKIEKKIIKALDRISLDIKPGEVYGIIGRNGSGKSTLLKVLSRIIYPTNGRVRISGNVTPLLGVGSGFHPELAGRENIYLYSAILGRKNARTKELFDDIVSFAELEDFIDEPIHIYSSGMVARLGFAIAMAERPEILLIDEVLSVGDEKFKDKCNERFQEFARAGTTIVFVSHNLQAAAEICQRTSWINQGKLIMTGSTKEVIQEYRKYLRQQN